MVLFQFLINRILQGTIFVLSAVSLPAVFSSLWQSLWHLFMCCGLKHQHCHWECLHLKPPPASVHFLCLCCGSHAIWAPAGDMTVRFQTKHWEVQCCFIKLWKIPAGLPPLSEACVLWPSPLLVWRITKGKDVWWCNCMIGVCPSCVFLFCSPVLNRTVFTQHLSFFSLSNFPEKSDIFLFTQLQLVLFGKMTVIQGMCLGEPPAFHNSDSYPAEIIHTC